MYSVKAGGLLRSTALRSCHCYYVTTTDIIMLRLGEVISFILCLEDVTLRLQPTLVFKCVQPKQNSNKIRVSRGN